MYTVNVGSLGYCNDEERGKMRKSAMNCRISHESLIL